ncbi:unnamed protein product [Trichogramma brassicae]|uniref:Uncharacterized protein n=1 Tax=Trichogramma brassicae TaxID=86971 RepID=A0A6H5I4D7_9HYME|nr:unnamed protein product [Trichogramma brassicae]
MPYGQAIVLELLEQRAYDVAEFLTLMLNHDIELRNAEPQLREWTEPCLIVNKELIDRLRQAVLAYFSDFDSVKTTTMPLIALARAIEEDMSDQYWWIADVLYQCALSAALGQHDLEPDDEFVARLRYTYARFLHYKRESKKKKKKQSHYNFCLLKHRYTVKNPRAALEHARIAKMDSCNKSWTLYGANSGFERDSLFKESVLLLHHVLLEVADQECDPAYAVKSCEAAIKNAHNGASSLYIKQATICVLLCIIYIRACSVQRVSRVRGALSSGEEAAGRGSPRRRRRKLQRHPRHTRPGQELPEHLQVPLQRARESRAHLQGSLPSRDDNNDI